MSEYECCVVYVCLNGSPVHLNFELVFFFTV